MPLVTKTVFAKMAGVSAKSISYATTRGDKVLAPALVGKKIDTVHPAARSYLELISEKKGQPVQTEAPVLDSRTQEIITSGHYSIDELVDSLREETQDDVRFNMLKAFVHKTMIKHLPTDIRRMAHMTLDELVTVFGTDKDFYEWLKASKTIEEIFERRIKSASTIGELVSRDIVKKGIVGPIDTFSRNMLSDGVKTIQQDMRARISSGESPEECEAVLQKTISGFLRRMKDRINRELERLGEP